MAKTNGNGLLIKVVGIVLSIALIFATIVASYATLKATQDSQGKTILKLEAKTVSMDVYERDLKEVSKDIARLQEYMRIGFEHMSKQIDGLNK